MDCLIKKNKKKKNKGITLLHIIRLRSHVVLVICIVDPKSELKTILPIHHCHASS
jgi:hypothetical protein